MNSLMERPLNQPLLRDLLGQGGWGDVYRVRQEGRELALKMLNGDHLNERDQRRFQREFEVLRELDHPALVKVFQQGSVQGRPYYTMEMVQGSNLFAYLKVHPEAFSALLEQLLEALNYIHSRGIVHRDLKPDNLIVQPDGRLRLLDFGLARSLDDDVHFTRTGTILGTPEYMSPEQVKGQPVDARSDLYSAGIIFYEALAGRTPFRSKELETVLYRILHESPQALPPHSQACLIHWMLEKDAELRPASAAAALRRLRGQDTHSCGKLSWRRWRQSLAQKPWLTFAAGLATGLATWLLR